jgi:hypothetical protein
MEMDHFDKYAGWKWAEHFDLPAHEPVR